MEFKHSNFSTPQPAVFQIALDDLGWSVRKLVLLLEIIINMIVILILNYRLFGLLLTARHSEFL